MKMHLLSMVLSVWCVLRDPITASHLDAVGLLSRRLAILLDLEPISIARITTAARLHDVGKLAVPLETLNKPGLLDELEWADIRRHPDLGGSIVSGFPQLEKYRAIVRGHHERVDGRGYPDGLLGSEIPYEARVIAVADRFPCHDRIAAIFAGPHAGSGAGRADELQRYAVRTRVCRCVREDDGLSLAEFAVGIRRA